MDFGWGARSHGGLQPQLLFAARRYSRRLTRRLTPATLVAVRGRPILASAVSSENKFARDQFNEAGTAAQIRAALTEANRLSFYMMVKA